MAFTAIDPTTALIVIDLQRGIVDLPPAHPVGESGRVAIAFGDTATDHGLHSVAYVIAGIGALTGLMALLDRSIPRRAGGGAASGELRSSDAD